ncbi:MAG: EVE domain-containing protein [Propionicimonas sp.]|uniref:hypothetical protein n=1 Tax=Propionicimonas sp. TaxID=1955623 RepID=UPI003D125D7C
MATQHTTRERFSWISTISLNHVYRGIAGGFIEADDGAHSRLERLQAGDRIAFYSPRTDHPDGDPLQQFTAWGVVTGAEAARVELGRGPHPWRRAVRYEPSVPVPVRELVDRLGFVPDATHWGLPFRRGLFRIPDADFDVIVEAMGAARQAA